MTRSAKTSAEASGEMTLEAPTPAPTSRRSGRGSTTGRRIGLVDRHEERTVAVLLDVGPANAALQDAQLQLTVAGWRRRWDFVETDVTARVPAQGKHRQPV